MVVTVSKKSGEENCESQIVTKKAGKKFLPGDGEPQIVTKESRGKKLLPSDD